MIYRKVRSYHTKFLKYGSISIAKVFVPVMKEMKIGSKTLDCIFKGYAHNSATSRFCVFNPYTHKNTIMKLCNVSFFENIFLC